MQHKEIIQKLHPEQHPSAVAVAAAAAAEAAAAAAPPPEEAAAAASLGESAADISAPRGGSGACTTSSVHVTAFLAPYQHSSAVSFVSTATNCISL